MARIKKLAKNIADAFLKASLRKEFNQYDYRIDLQTTGNPVADSHSEHWPLFNQLKFQKFSEEIERFSSGDSGTKEEDLDFDPDEIRRAHKLEFLVYVARFREFGPTRTLEQFYSASKESGAWAESIAAKLNSLVFGNEAERTDSEKVLSSVMVAAGTSRQRAKLRDEWDQISTDINDRFALYKGAAKNAEEYFEYEATRNEVMPDITLSMISGESGKSNTELILNFLFELADRFECDVVDYLVMDEQAEELVSADKVWGVGKQDGTWPSDRYRSGAGVTGSVIYVAQGTGIRCVGTNHIELDPRTSKSHIDEHRRSHDHSLRNWWCFPVFVKDELSYVIRVVNRIDDEHKDAVWTSKDLMVIANEIRALETVLRVKTDVELDFANSALTPRVWDSLKDTLLGEQRDEVTSRKIVGEKPLFNAINFLMRIVNCSIEGKPVSMTIGFTKDPGRIRTAEVFPTDEAFVMPADFKSLNHEPMDQNRSCGIFSADEIIHHFDVEGKFVKLSEVTQLSTPIQTFASHMDTDDLEYLVQARVSGVIRIFGKDGFLGDITMSEATGVWNVRSRRDFHRAVVGEKYSENRKTALAAALDIAFEVSELHKGAGLALMNHGSKVTLPSGANARSFNCYLDQDKNTVVSLSTTDGALVFNTDRKLTLFACFFPQPGKKSLNSYGTRHNSALFASKKWLADIFVISENGGISFFRNGDVIILKDKIEIQ